MNRIAGVLLSVLIFVSCQNNDDAANISELDIELVTGIQAQNSQSGPVIRFGNPNVISNQAVMYPNPTIGVLRIENSINNGLTDVWIVKANAQRIFQDIDYDEILNSNLYSEGEIENVSDHYFSFNETGNAIINVEDFEKGYYKVFIKINNQIEWHNAYIGNDMEISDLSNYWN